MGEIEKEVLKGEVDALSAALAEERYRHVAGLEPTPSLVEVFQRHGTAAHRETVARLREAGDEALAARVAALRAERAQAADEEAWRAAEATSSGKGPGGSIGLNEAQLALADERDHGRRMVLGSAVVEATASAAREAAVETRARAGMEVGLVPDWDAVLEADAVLAASDDAYRDVLAWLVRSERDRTELPRADLSRGDLLYVLALHRWEGLFKPSRLAIVLERLASPLRLDLGRIRIDDAARPAQWPGAHACGPRVSLRRMGGAADWLGLLGAVGASLAWASAATHRRHAATPATVGSVLSSLLLQEAFLVRHLDVDRKYVPDLTRALAVRRLFALRARAAAFRVATEVARGTTGAAWHDAYRAAMALATGAVWPARLAARDGDASRALEALRGAARAEALRQAWVERFDEDWWRNPRAAEALNGVLRDGDVRLDAEPKLAAGAQALVASIE